jgi:zinc protease
MMVLVVGDLTPAAVEPLLRRQFATLAAAPGRPLPPAALVLPALASMQAKAFTVPTQTTASVDLVALAPRPRDTVADLRVSEADTVVLSLLNRRLAERAAADPRIGRAFATAEPGPDQWYTHFRIEAQTSTDHWALAVNLLEGELRRARQRGFQPEEVEEAVSSLFANLIGSRDEMATYRPSALADAVAARLAAGRSWHDLDTEVRLSAEFLNHFTPADAAGALSTLFPENGLHLLVSRPTPLPGGGTALLAAYRSSAERALGSGLPVAEGLPLFHYGDLLPAGTVALQRSEPDLRVTSVAFANGVRVNLRPSLGESRRFGLSVRLGRGLADTPREQPRLEMLALAFLSSCGLGKNSQEEISRLLRLHAIAFNVVSDDNQTYFNASGPSAELPFALRFVTALLSDLELNPAQLNRAVSRYAAVQRQETTSTQGWAKNELLYQLTNEDPRLRLSSPQEISRYPYADLTAWMGRHWLNGPVEVGIVGDLEPNATVAALSRTLGALPARHSFPDDPAEHFTLRAQAYRRTEIEPLPDEAAALRVAWPAPGARSVADQAALQLAIDTVVDRIRIKVREDLGATYAPTGGLYRYAPQPDFAFGWIELTFDPKQANTLGLLVLNLADELARRGVTPEEFTRLREPRRTATAAQLGSDDWWLHQVLVRAQSQPEVLAETRALATVYGEVTREDVNRAAASYLRASNASAILVIPQSAQPPPGQP